MLTFSVAVFISAGLLFFVQPMVTRMLLPVLGGTPAIWNTAMVFFQGSLFTGYVYAWLAVGRLRLRQQMGVHLAFLIAAALFLPIAAPGSGAPPDPAHPQQWVLSTLLSAVAVPFVAIAGSATLLQHWFAHSSHPRATEPYFLYAASNAGSLLALLAYPLLVEPALGLRSQASAWSVGYAGLIALTAICAVGAWRAGTNAAPAVTAHASPAVSAPDAVTWRRRLAWLYLGFVPSMMLLGVTLHLSMDVASVPLLWVVPLGAYLLSFVIAFAARPLVPAGILLPLHALAMIFFAFGAFPKTFALAVAAHVGILFLTGLLCHRALYEKRPAPAHLAEFYLWVTLGGWAGGVAGGLVAPLIFESVFEYPLAIVLACLARFAAPRRRGHWLRELWPGAAAASVYLGGTLWLGSGLPAPLPAEASWTALWVLVLGALILCHNRPAAFALAVGVMVMDHALALYPGRSVAMEGKSFIVGQTTPARYSHAVVFQDRTFFGVHRVFYEAGANAHVLYHGTTMHGAQMLSPERRLEPVMYYHQAGPIAQLLARRRVNAPLTHVGVIGLGTGALACHMRDGERMTFFEIDPTVVAVASDPRLFTYLRDCGNRPEILLGDGRLRVAEMPDGIFDVFVVDAFSSDAIPVHLMTEEALALYLRKLRPHGVVAFHITNRYLRLAPVLARLAMTGGLAGLYQAYTPSAVEHEQTALASAWVVVARESQDLAFLAGGGWEHIVTQGLGDRWTDSYSNLLGAMRW
jgi:spermidine synthase